MDQQCCVDTLTRSKEMRAGKINQRLAESNNKNFLKILKKTVEQSQRDWHIKLDHALWADRIAPKSSIGCFPYELVYGKEAVLPINLQIPALKLSSCTWPEDEKENLQKRLNDLIALEELREDRASA